MMVPAADGRANARRKVKGNLKMLFFDRGRRQSMLSE
jgi:hypothetical protein